MKSNGQIISEDNCTYNGSKNIPGVNMKRKKDSDQYRIVREYKNAFSCDELIERIIRYHMDERNLFITI